MNKKSILEFIQSPPVAIVFAATMIIFVVLTIVSTLTVGSGSKRVVIEGPQSFTDALRDTGLSDYSMANIQKSFAKITKKNKISAEDQNRLKVEIRESSVKKKSFSEFNLEYINFIIDLPEQKQSYQISHAYSTSDDDSSHIDEENATQTFCLRDEKKIKFENFNCKDSYKDEDPKYRIIKNYARFTTGQDPEILIDEDNPNHIRAASPEINEENQKHIIDQAKDWIKSLGFSVKGYTFEAIGIGGGAPYEE